jgi:hypothetical protein
MNQPTLKEFLRVLYSDWTSGVSGSLSVPFTILALYVRNASAKTLFGVLAVLALLVAVYRVWKKERLELLTEFQKNSDAERQRREVEMQTAREQLVKLERENRQAAALRELERRDEQVLECVKRQFEDLTNRGMRPGSMAIAFTEEFAKNTARQIGVETQAVKESLVRLNAAKKLNSLGW